MSVREVVQSGGVGEHEPEAGGSQQGYSGRTGQKAEQRRTARTEGGGERRCAIGRWKSGFPVSLSLLQSPHHRDQQRPSFASIEKLQYAVHGVCHGLRESFGVQVCHEQLEARVHENALQQPQMSATTGKTLGGVRQLLLGGVEHVPGPSVIWSAGLVGGGGRLFAEIREDVEEGDIREQSPECAGVQHQLQRRLRKQQLEEGIQETMTLGKDGKGRKRGGRRAGERQGRQRWIL